MKRAIPILILLLLTALGLFLGLHRRLAPVESEVVPIGKTVTQVLPGPDGKSEVWRITKKEVPHEKLPDLVLPEPAPRGTPEDERTESARALDAQALEAWKHGDLQGALDKFEAAVKADPDDPEPHSDYGRLLTRMTDYAKAGPHLDRAAQLKPSDAQVWLDLANYYERSMLLERAMYAQERAEKLAGGVPIVRDENGLMALQGKTFP
jgi:tetratricopeptide (TPR) repeat protein